MNQDAIDFMQEKNPDCVVEDQMGEVPAEILVRESYRYKGQLKKLESLLIFLWPKVESRSVIPKLVSLPTKAVNLTTGKSLHDLAVAAHKLWQSSETEAVLALMERYDFQARINASENPCFDETWIIDSFAKQYRKRNGVSEEK